MPIVAFNLGAQGERLRTYSSAKLLSLSSDAQQVNLALVGSVRSLSSKHELGEGFMEQKELAENQQTRNIQSEDLATTAQVVKLPQGIYCCTVKEGGAAPHFTETFALPALQIGIAPVQSGGKVEILSAAAKLDRWLAYKGDMILVRIAGGEASLLLTSVRLKDSPALAVGIERLNAHATSHASEDNGREAGAVGSGESLDVGLVAHVRYAGDLTFEEGRAGWPGKQMWIEGFAISSIGDLPSSSIEYRGVISGGIPTPWLQGQTLCGSKGGGLPLVGYAVRLNAEFAEQYECEYSGVFSSGARVGPKQNGALCSSEVVDDPLEVIEIKILKRTL